MLASRQIEVGKCYINENIHSAREVHRVDRQNVVFSDYDLQTGKLCGSPNKHCSKEEIIHWADREATRAEARSLKREELEALFKASPRSDQPSPVVDPLAGLQEAARRSSFMK